MTTINAAKMQEADSVSLSEFLQVAREQGANNEFLKRAHDYLNAPGVQEVIQHMADFADISFETATTKQLATYLGIDSTNLPPVDRDSLEL